MREDSLKKRYLYKILSKLAMAPFTLLTQAIIPRGLGPELYGQFTFLTNFFQQVLAFFDSGTSLAFYTSLSKNLKDKSIIRFYGSFTCVAILLTSSVTSLVYFFDKEEYIFPDQQVLFVWMALFYSSILWLSDSLYKVVDAYGLTVKGEVILILQRVLGLLMLAGMYFLGKITLLNFFLYNYFILIVLIVWWSFHLFKNDVNLIKIPPLSKDETIKKVKFFWKYSSPLITYSLLGMIAGIFDNWLLIQISGSAQQGYFGLAFRLSSISFLFTGAMTQLLTREFSIAFVAGDEIKIRSLFERFVPILYVVVAFLSIFFAVQADVLTFLFGGDSFKEAIVAISVMSLYPIHQTYGQLSGSLFYATGKTELYRNIGCSMLPLSLVLTSILIGPPRYHGLELGGLGLAIKTLAVQFIGVNIQLYYNTKFLNLSFKKYFSHQLIVVGVFFILAFCAKSLAQLFLGNILLIFIVSGFLYTLLSIMTIYIFPIVLSLNKTEINQFIGQLKSKILLKKQG